MTSSSLRFRWKYRNKVIITSIYTKEIIYPFPAIRIREKTKIGFPLQRFSQTIHILCSKYPRTGNGALQYDSNCFRRLAASVLWRKTSSVTKEGQGGTFAPGRSTLGGPYWGRRLKQVCMLDWDLQKTLTNPCFRTGVRNPCCVGQREQKFFGPRKGPDF